MPPKECNPKCTGRCNKNKPPTADKSCDPKCTGRCSKRSAGTSPPDEYPPEKPETEQPITEIEEPITETEQPTIETAPVPFSDDDKSDLTDEHKIVDSGTGGEIKFIIMDLDGVVLDIETVYTWVIKDLVQKYNIPSIEVQHIVDLQDEETSTKFCKDYKLKISPQDFMVDFTETSKKHLGNTPLMPGIENLVKYFLDNNLLIAIATTSSKEAFIHKTKNHSQLFQKFCHVVLGNSDPEVTARKPSPILYQVCASRFPSKTDPKNILVLEDAPEGVVAAKRAGMKVVWFPNVHMKMSDGKDADLIINSIEEFDPQQIGLPPLK